MGKNNSQEQISWFSPENAEAQASYEGQFLDSVDPEKIQEHHEFFAKVPGEESTPGAWERRKYIKEELESYGLEADIQTFYPYMADTQEVDVSVDMVAPHEQSLSVKEEEQPWHERFDEISVGFAEGTPSADVTAEAVYANYGRAEDYEVLNEHGVEVEGKIVLARYGEVQRSEKPYQAYINDAAGLIMFTDPADDGFCQGEVYPDGPWMPPDGIQRGTIYRWTLYPGDPLTPGWAATKHAPRIPVEESSISQIPPTTPIGYGAAEPLLENLAGPEAPEDWQGGLPITYRLGGPDSTEINLNIDVEYDQRELWNVVSTIPGSEHPDELVVSGVHPDSWGYGAYDHASGTASHLEMARSLGKLLDAGWRPKRTLVLGFFGGEERGLAGSTEFTKLLGEGMSRVVAYVNHGMSAGENFGLIGTPSLDDFVFEAAKEVEWPVGSEQTLYEDWLQKTKDGGDDFLGYSLEDEEDEPAVARPRSGSDYISFYARYGAPVLMTAARTDAGCYHSTYDDIHALKKFRDPDGGYQAGSSQLVGLLAMRLAGADVLPLRYSRYANEVAAYLEEFDEEQQAEFGRSVVDISQNVDQAQAWAEAAAEFEETAGQLVSNDDVGVALREVNQGLMEVERALLTRRGMPDRPWHRHQIYAPEFHDGFGVQQLPGLHDALYLSEDEDKAREYAVELQESLSEATELLEEATVADTSGRSEK